MNDGKGLFSTFDAPCDNRQPPPGIKTLSTPLCRNPGGFRLSVFSHPAPAGPFLCIQEPVESREAVARRDELIAHLASLPAVPGALDQIVQHFGTDMVAEVTGRSRRIIRKGERLVVQNRSGSANLSETHAFMDDRIRASPPRSMPASSTTRTARATAWSGPVPCAETRTEQCEDPRPAMPGGESGGDAGDTTPGGIPWMSGMPQIGPPLIFMTGEALPTEQ